MEWIKIKDKLPERDQRVLVYWNPKMYVCRFVYETDYNQDSDVMEPYFLAEYPIAKIQPRYGDSNRMYVHLLEYWMPLPEKPVR
jgi:hypothetical protein